MPRQFWSPHMKRTISAVITASVLALGVVGTTTGTAFADCPYTNCTETAPDTKLPDSIPAGTKVKIKFSIDVPGNVEATGTVKIKIKKNGFETTKVVAYAGGSISVKSKKLKPGNYFVKTIFIPTPGSIFNPSRSRDILRVS